MDSSAYNETMGIVSLIGFSVSAGILSYVFGAIATVYLFRAFYYAYRGI